MVSLSRVSNVNETFLKFDCRIKLHVFTMKARRESFMEMTFSLHHEEMNELYWPAFELRISRIPLKLWKRFCPWPCSSLEGVKAFLRNAAGDLVKVCHLNAKMLVITETYSDKKNTDALFQKFPYGSIWHLTHQGIIFTDIKYFCHVRWQKLA